MLIKSRDHKNALTQFKKAAILFSKLNAGLGEAICLLAQCYLLSIDEKLTEYSKFIGLKNLKSLLDEADSKFEALTNKEKSEDG